MGFFGSLINAVGSAVTGNYGGAVAAFGQGLSNSEDQRNQFKNQQALAEQQNQYNVDMFNRQSDFNAEQQEKANQYNTSEREASQQWSEKMMDKQNEYNSPANQLRLLQEAGINPLSFDGSVADSASPVGADNPGVGAASASALGAGQGSASMASPTDALISAKSANLRASTEKIQSETEGQNLDNSFKNQINQGTLDLQSAQVRFYGSQSDVSEEEAKKIHQETLNLEQNINNLKVSCDEARARINELNASRDYQAIRTAREKIASAFDKQRIIAEVNKDKALSAYYHANSKVCDAMLEDIEAQASMHTALSGYYRVQREVTEATAPAIVKVSNLNADKAEVQVNLDKEYGEMDRRIQWASQAMGILTSGINSVVGVGLATKMFSNFTSPSIKNPQMFTPLGQGAPSSWQGF